MTIEQRAGDPSFPTLESFLSADAAEVAAVAPTTVIVSVNGTRRSAAMEGIAPYSNEFLQWSRHRMIEYMDLLFSHGVRHIIAAAIISPNRTEFAAYWDRFLNWTAQGLSGPEARADYAARGWRVRMIGTEYIPELRPAADNLIAATPDNWSHTLWWTVAPAADTPWDAVFEHMLRSGARTRAEAIRAVYGEEIPLASMFISFGKPIVIYDLIPPLLVGRLQSYWIMRPGYRLDESMLRHIFYDYAYVRRAARDAQGEHATLHEDMHRAAWQTEAVLGVGQRLGPFWYPAPFPS